MTLRSKYALLGSLFGACFPLAGTLVYAYIHYQSLDLTIVLRAQSESPLLWIIDTAPFWLGLFARGVGQREEALREVIRDREATIARRTEDLERALESAEAASKAKGRFLANMSHEIRTPMTAILGYAESLQDHDTDAKQREEAAEIIHSNGRHLLQVINDILDFSKIEAGKMTIERIPCSPRAIVAEVLLLMDIHARRKGLEFRAVCDGPLPDTIHSDPTRIRQILLNLIGNAIKFTERGSVELKVRLLAEGAPAQIEFRISDTGIGMSSEQLESLFRSFSQADDSTSRKYGGTGLGLAVCKRLVALMSGACQVESTQGEGSCFAVVLPAGDLEGVRISDLPAGDCGAPRDLPERLEVEACLEGCRILLAEDNPVNARLIRSILAKAGADVSVVENGRAALQTSLAKLAAGDPFDIILMDIQMPEMDGCESTRRLRESGYDWPVLALTANAMPADQRSCLEAGCDACATKPINRAELLAQIRRLTRAGSQAVVIE